MTPEAAREILLARRAELLGNIARHRGRQRIPGQRQFGREGLTQRLTVSGQGVRTDAQRQVSTIEVAGIMTVTGGSR